MKALNVIRKPVVTEKTAIMEEKQVYSFWINPAATKIDVKMAMKELYGVDAAKVRMVKASAKVRKLRKGTFNKRQGRLKAYITLRGGAKLDLNKFGKVEKESKIKLAGPKVTAKAPAKKAKAEKSGEKTEKKPAKSKSTK